MGYGLVRQSKDGSCVADSWGVLKATRGRLLGPRLHQLYSELLSLIRDLCPDEVAVETPFVSINARAAMAIGQAQGLALMAAAEQGLPASSYSPPQVKLAVSGHGHASKQQIQQAIALQLEIDSDGIPEDAADALAVALCHIQHFNEASLVAAEGIKLK